MQARGPYQLSILLSLLIAALGGCGPMYQTDLTFKPPKSAEGRACIFQCEQGKGQCQTLEELRAERCQERSERERDRCERQLLRTENRQPKWHECNVDSCQANIDRCDDTYKACYQSCGGEIEAVTRCVANCQRE